MGNVPERSWGRALSGGMGAPKRVERASAQKKPPTHFGQGPTVLTCRRKCSASAALPAAMHWKEAFWPALTSTSPRRKKCGAFAAGVLYPRGELGLRPLQAGAETARTPSLAPEWAGTHRRGS